MLRDAVEQGGRGSSHPHFWKASLECARLAHSLASHHPIRLGGLTNRQRATASQLQSLVPVLTCSGGYWDLPVSLFQLGSLIFYSLGGATKSEVTSPEQRCNQVSDAPHSTVRVDWSGSNNHLQTLLHNLSSFWPIAYWSLRWPCLGSTSMYCEPHRDRWLVPPPGPGPQRTGTLQILAELANERGRRGMNGQHALA